MTLLRRAWSLVARLWECISCALFNLFTALCAAIGTLEGDALATPGSAVGGELLPEDYLR